MLLQAQEPELSTQVTFKISNTNNELLPLATITVLDISDSLNKQEKISDSTGRAIFQLLQEHLYLVRVSSVSFAPLEKRITIKGNNPVFSIALTPQTKALNNVVVTATRPLMRQEDDKTIVDPENLAISSTNAYEIMEKTPGLFVDQDGNVYLSSTTPATIYINGREQKMSAADIATILKSLPPNAIASIEIMRTPSARYDATGSGGIVNIVLKKGIRIGLTGSVNAGFNQGRYGNQFVGLNLNNNNGRTTTYLNLQVSRRNTYEQIKTDRIFAPDSLLSQDAFTRFPTHSYYVGFGAGYQLNKKWDISYDGRLSYNRSKNRSTNRSQINQISNGKVITSNEAQVQNGAQNVNLTQGLAFKYKIDSLGSEWTTDLSYTFAPNTTDQLFTTYFLLPARNTQFGDGAIENSLHFFSAQTNWLKKLPRKITVEAGLKSTHVRFTNSTDYYRQTGGTRIKDDFRTGAFRYTENINSAYVQASKTFGSIILKAGTRMENTNMRGHQLVPRDTSFNIHRTDLFPYVFLSRKLMKIAGYDLRAYLVYRRTLSRPAYEYLNPSLRFIDPYLVETGNPSLRPQFTQNYEANVSVDERPIFAVGVNNTKDIFTQVIYQADSSRSQAYRTYDNLGANKEVYFRALGAIPPGKRFFFVAGAQYNHNFYQGLYENKPLQFKRGSWTFFTYQSLKLTPNTQLMLNGYVRFKGQIQFYELSSFGALNLSVNQQLLKKKLTLGLALSDLFFTSNNEFTLQQGTVNARGFRQGDTRRVGLTLRYNFGLRRKEDNNIFNIEAPDKGN